MNEKEFRRELERELEVGLAAVPLPAAMPERARYRAGPAPRLGSRLWVATLAAAASLALVGGLGTAAAGRTGAAGLASELASAVGLRHAPQAPVRPPDAPGLAPPVEGAGRVVPPPIPAPLPAEQPARVAPGPRQNAEPGHEAERPDRQEPAERPEPPESAERPRSQPPQRRAPEASPPRAEPPERD